MRNVIPRPKLLEVISKGLGWDPNANSKFGAAGQPNLIRQASSITSCLLLWISPQVCGVLGARVWRLHRAYRFACSPFMAGFMELKHSERRQLKTAGSAVAEKVVKLTQNAIFGRCCMNPDKFRNTNAYVDPAKLTCRPRRRGRRRSGSCRPWRGAGPAAQRSAPSRSRCP